MAVRPKPKKKTPRLRGGERTCAKRPRIEPGLQLGGARGGGGRLGGEGLLVGLEGGAERLGDGELLRLQNIFFPFNAFFGYSPLLGGM